MPPASTAGNKRTRLKGDAAWRILGLLACYRLLVPLLLTAVQWLGGRWTLVPPRPGLFLSACLIYLGLAAALLVASLRRQPGLRTLTWVCGCADSVALAVILYAGGGIGNGLGTLLVLPVMATAVIAGPREGAQLAGIATAGLVAQQVLVERGHGVTATATDCAAAVALGAVLLAIALSAEGLAKRLRGWQALHAHQRIDLEISRSSRSTSSGTCARASWSSTPRMASG